MRKIIESNASNKFSVNEGDVLYLDSENGMKYTIEVISVNDYREPSIKYAIDMVDGNGARYSDCYGDCAFVGQDFMDKCYK